MSDTRAMRAPPPDAYEQIAADAVPDGLRWRARVGYHKNLTYETLFSMNNTYKRMRTLDTGAVRYFKLKDKPSAPTAPEQIDHEPEFPCPRLRVGGHYWFVNDTRWFLVEVVRRTRAVLRWESVPPRITVRSVTGFDSTRRTPWSYGEELELIDNPNNRLFRRLRKLAAKKL